MSTIANGGGAVVPPSQGAGSSSANAAEHDAGVDPSTVPVGKGVLPASAATNHQMFVALLIMLVFVALCVVIAGDNPKVGNGIVMLFVVLGAGQAITHVNPFVAWVAKHPLTPDQIQN